MDDQKVLVQTPAWVAGDALVTATDCFLGFEDLRREFDSFAFIDLCSGIDSAILHDRLYTCGLPPTDENPILSTLLSEGVLTDIASSGVARIEPDVMINHPMSRVPMTLMTLIETGQVKFTLTKDTNRESFEKSLVWLLSQLISVAKTFIVEERFPVLTVPTASTAIVIDRHPGIAAEKVAYSRIEVSLAHQYKELKELLLRERSELDGHAQLDIPPLALDVLSRTKNSDDLGDAVMEARRRFEKLRDYFRNLDELLNSGSVTLREKAVESAKLRRAMASLVKSLGYESSPADVSISFSRKANEIASLDKMLNGISVDDFSLGKLVGLLISHLDEARWKFKLRPLHGLKRQYFNLSSQDIRHVVKRHFLHEISNYDRCLLSDYVRLADACKNFFDTHAERLAEYGPPT